MSRLIDADEETRFANENLPDAHAGVITAFLRDCATVDPVRHGQWIDFIPFLRREGLAHKCSLCGIMNDAKTPFCPYCGARMDGGDAT